MRSNHLQTVLDLDGSREEAGALLKQRSQVIHVRHLVRVLQLLHPQLDPAVVDVANQQLEYGGADVFQLDGAVVGLLEVGREHGAEEAALRRQHQPVQVELCAVHGDSDVGKQPVLQGEVHDALDHAAGMGAVGEGVPQEVVLLSHGTPDTEAPLLI